MVQTKTQKEWYLKKKEDPEWREKRNQHARDYRANLDPLVATEHKNRYGDKIKQKKNKNKLILINEHGGKCVMCGYNKNFGALDFHHDKDKESTISDLLFNLDRARDEAKDCILLCVRCHRELHHPECNIG
jgi:hypothetical protein